MKKQDYLKSGKQARRQEQRRDEADKRNAVYAALPLAEKRKRNPNKKSLFS
jgi:hypothetical protein